MFTNSYQYKDGTKFFSIELKKYFIDYVPASKNTLFITFENAADLRIPRSDGMRTPWGMRPLHSLGYCILGIKPKSTDWYRNQELHDFFKSTKFLEFGSSFENVIFYGSSMGGYAALAFAASLPGSVVLSINPQTTLNPRLVPWESRFGKGRAQNWEGDFSDAAEGCRYARKVYIVYDPLHKLDRKHVERLSGENIVLLKIPLLGHSLPAWLQEMGILKDIAVHAANEELNIPVFSKMARKRRNLARYYVTMAERTRNKNVARRCIEMAVNKANSNEKITHAIVSLSIRLELWSIAAKLTAELLKKDIDVSEHISTAVKKLTETDNHDVAIKLLDEILAIKPNYADYRHLRSLCVKPWQVC